jgi:hypothetical protein
MIGSVAWLGADGELTSRPRGGPGLLLLALVLLSGVVDCSGEPPGAGPEAGDPAAVESADGPGATARRRLDGAP